MSISRRCCISASLARVRSSRFCRFLVPSMQVKLNPSPFLSSSSRFMYLLRYRIFYSLFFLFSFSFSFHVSFSFLSTLLHIWLTFTVNPLHTLIFCLGFSNFYSESLTHFDILFRVFTFSFFAKHWCSYLKSFVLFHWSLIILIKKLISGYT